MFIADAAAVNPCGINTLLANGVGAFFISSKSTFINGPRSLPRNPTYCIILDSGVFDNFVLGDKVFAKAL